MRKKNQPGCKCCGVGCTDCPCPYPGPPSTLYCTTTVPFAWSGTLTNNYTPPGMGYLGAPSPTSWASPPISHDGHLNAFWFGCNPIDHSYHLEWSCPTCISPTIVVAAYCLAGSNRCSPFSLSSDTSTVTA
jgi:hypothetical protein